MPTGDLEAHSYWSIPCPILLWAHRYFEFTALQIRLSALWFLCIRSVLLCTNLSELRGSVAQVNLCVALPYYLWIATGLCTKLLWIIAWTINLDRCLFWVSQLSWCFMSGRILRLVWCVFPLCKLFFQVLNYPLTTMSLFASPLLVFLALPIPSICDTQGLTDRARPGAGTYLRLLT